MRRNPGPHLFLILLLVPTFLRAQTSPAPARIQLTSGGPAVTVEGDVERDKKEVVFVFQAKAGSKFSGDYKIAVATFDPRRVHFTLTVRVYR